MDRLNDISLAYFMEEIYQYEMMLKGCLNDEYREYLNKKLKIYKYTISLIKEYGGDNN